MPAYASYGGNGGYAGYPAYQVPYAYEDLYFDEPGYDYHLAGGGIYQVDPVTQLVSALVGLVTRANFRVGQPLPSGYDTYNVPSQYRANYYDRPDALYRYDDGQIYQVDPRTRIVQAAIPLSYDGYVIGQLIPPGYPGYPVPEYYQGYYASPDYDYRYYDGGIYQVDRDSQIVSALAALVTATTSLSAACCRSATTPTTCPMSIAIAIRTAAKICTAIATGGSTRSMRRRG